MIDIPLPAIESFLSQLSPESIGQLQAAFTTIAGNAISGVELMNGGIREVVEWLWPKKVIDKGLLFMFSSSCVCGGPIVLGAFMAWVSKKYPPTENE